MKNQPPILHTMLAVRFCFITKEGINNIICYFAYSTHRNETDIRNDTMRCGADISILIYTLTDTDFR